MSYGSSKSSGSVSEGSAGPPMEMLITYDWAGTGMYDLDTGTTFLGVTIGWTCGTGGTYVEWASWPVSGEDESINGSEVVRILVEQAFLDAAWTISATVDLCAGWFSPAGGSGNATVTVTYNGDTQAITIAPGSQDVCATTAVGTVVVYEDGSFTLTVAPP